VADHLTSFFPAGRDRRRIRHINVIGVAPAHSAVEQSVTDYVLPLGISVPNDGDVLRPGNGSRGDGTLEE
jgi:hypothetical protein